MKLAKLFDYYRPLELEYSGDIDCEITNIAVHSDDVKPGCLFFALKGEKTDGKNFIDSAILNGAVAVAMSKEGRGKEIPAMRKEARDVVEIILSDVYNAISKWSAALYNFPAKEMEIVGVTGTNGKTTVTNIIYRILTAEGGAGLIGTSGHFYGKKSGHFGMTTPRANDLHFLFRAMLDDGISKVAMEVSSHSLELKRVQDIKFKSAIWTNLSPEHLDFHKTMENYYKAKLKLFSLVTEKNKSSAIVNIDNDYGRRVVKDIGYEATTYGMTPEADYRAEIKNISLNGTEFLLITPSKSMEMKINLIGKFNVYNCLAAIAWAVEGGRDMDTVCDIVSQAPGVRGRMELVKKGISTADSDKIVVIDYAHTPDALENVLLTLKNMKPKKLICVFGCGGDRDREKRPLMGKIAGKYSDVVYLTSDNPRSEDAASILLDIEVGIRDTTTNYYVITDREEAIKTAIENSSAGDCILIAGKGDEDYQIIGSTTIPFSDRLVVQKYL